MSMTIITAENFDDEVLRSDKPVIADFNADWCGPCQMLKPVIEEISKEREDIKFVSINIDDQEDIAYKYDVSSIPCLVKFDHGREKSRSVGFKPKPAILSFIG